MSQQPATQPEAAQPTNAIDRRRALLILALSWLVAVNLRTVLLAVPPVLPLIHHDLRLSYTEVGLLTSLPTLLMGLAAVPGAFLIARTSTRAAITAGLAVLAAGALLRAVAPGALLLFLFTIVLSFGIAIAQPALPVLVKQWFPRQAGQATAIYSNGLIIGEILAASLTGPLLLGAFGADAWRTTFVVWALPIVALLVVWMLLAPEAPRAPGVVRTRWQAGWRTGRGWRLGFLLGSGSLAYFAMNAWIPDYYKALGRADTAAALTVLNIMQLPVSLLLTLVARWLAGRRWPFVLAGLACLIGMGGWFWAPASTDLLWVALLGAGSSVVFLLGLALPPLLSTDREVAGLTGVMLTLGYTTAFLGPLIGGALWDASGVPALAFVPVVAASVAQVVLGATLPQAPAAP
jgi:CP family cyanate transporter-like MFS transporter